MLQTIHDRMKGWIAALLVGIIAASFLFWGIQYYLTGSNSSTNLASVGGVGDI